MDVKEKINIVTKHLVLEKEKNTLELERFINTDTSIDELTNEITGKINKYRDSISNLTIWLEFIDPISNPNEGNENK